MKVGIIILCRYSSSRLPGKILKEIQGKTILSYIYERAALSKKADEIIVATSTDPSDDAIENFCREHNHTCFRGSLEDVSGRFLATAIHNKLDYAVRINGDNLFCDPGLIDEAISYATSEELDFVSNVPGRTFPIGMSVEVVNAQFYQQLIERFVEDKYMEHVTLYLYETKEAFNVRYFRNESFKEAAGLQLAIDTPEDFQLATQIIPRLKPDHRRYGWIEISKIALNEKRLAG